jgi:hypothetical protein
MSGPFATDDLILLSLVYDKLAPMGGMDGFS